MPTMVGSGVLVVTDMTRTNPHTNAERAADSKAQYSFLSTGRVTTAPDGQSNGAHHVVVQESGAPADEPIPVLPTVPGDYFVPPEGAPVVVSPIAKNKYAVIATSIPSTVETPEIDPGERIVSHPMSEAKVHFKNDGTLEVHGDQQVVINGGTNGAITDVTGNDTSGDGNINEINITRNNDVLL